jgi:hypothetical protein
MSILGQETISGAWKLLEIDCVSAMETVSIFWIIISDPKGSGWIIVISLLTKICG